jgi:hypothetical protein
VTEAVLNNNTTASNTVGGHVAGDLPGTVAAGDCRVYGAQWGVKLSAAPTSLTVIDEDYNGTSR